MTSGSAGRVGLIGFLTIMLSFMLLQSFTMPVSAEWTVTQCNSVINSLNWKVKLIYSAWDERDRAYATADNYYRLGDENYDRYLQTGDEQYYRAALWYWGLGDSWNNYGNQRNSLANEYIRQFWSTYNWAQNNGCW